MTIKARLDKVETLAGKGAPVTIVAWCRNGTGSDEIPDGHSAHIRGEHVNRHDGETALEYFDRLKTHSNGGPVVFLEDRARLL
jgi:hypothetical protein